MMRIELAALRDADEIMRFLHEHWRSNHILSRSRELFLYDFQDGERLNIAVSRDETGAVTGLFGFMFYNSSALPDLAGSLWKAVVHVTEPMAGLKLRNFVMGNVPHRFFCAPGAGLQTRPVYEMLGMQWHRMHHYFLLNPARRSFELAAVPERRRVGGRVGKRDPETAVERMRDPGELQQFCFDDDPRLRPLKDRRYVYKRFFRHPIYSYDVYALRSGGAIANIMVCRMAEHGGSRAYRLVDFYGPEASMPQAASFLQEYIIDHDAEYADFVCHGFDHAIMKDAGFQDLDFSQDELIIPNYFEPFERKNVPVYCVADRVPGVHFRQVKADGDQDRPNRLPDDP